MIQNINRFDIPKCVELIKESFMTVANELGFDKNNAPRFTAFATTEERLYWEYDKESRIMCAYYFDDKIVGYYSLLFGENSECELNNLCVKPEYRHKKIGEQLLNHCYSYAQNNGCVKINIGIVEENVRLRKWYEAHGFTHKKTVKFDFFPFTCGYMEKEIFTYTK